MFAEVQAVSGMQSSQKHDNVVSAAKFAARSALRLVSGLFCTVPDLLNDCGLPRLCVCFWSTFPPFDNRTDKQLSKLRFVPSTHLAILFCILSLHVKPHHKWVSTAKFNIDCVFTGIEFRVTEEYDEDSPFSRPPSQPKPRAAPSADPKTDSPPPAPQDASHATARNDDQQGNGSTPALTSDPLTSVTETTIDTTVAQLQSHKQKSLESESRTGRHQIASDAPPPDRIAEGIEVADHPDDDQPGTTELMDPVNQKPGVKRVVDGQERKAPSRSPSEQGLLPHPERQTRQESEAEGGSGSAQKGQTDAAKEKAWWESAADSAVGAFESTKSAVLGGIESLTKGQGDKQATGDSHT